MTISGDKASNYTLTVSSFGSLTIEGKNVSELTLSTESLVYTGENLIDSIVFAPYRFPTFLNSILSL